MWAIRDFAGRYFSEDGWTDRTRDALLYDTCDEAECAMQENGIVDAYCIFSGGDGDWCQTCAKWVADHGKCHAFLDFTERDLCLGYEYAGRAEERRGAEAVLDFSAKHDEPSQPADTEIDEHKMRDKLKKNSLYGKQADESCRYAHGSIECIDAIRSALTPEEFRGFCKGNIMKYVWRERHKGGDADLDKARDYVGYAVAGDTDGEL